MQGIPDRKCTIATLVAICLGMAASGTSLAQGDIPPAAAKGLEVKALRIEGLDKSTARGLRSGLVLSGESKLLGRRYPVFYPESLREDLNRARLYLARRGHPKARVQASLLRRDKGVEIVLRIDPGPPVVVKKRSFTGLPVSLQDRAEQAVVLRPQDVFTDTALEESRQALVMLLEEESFAHADVRARVDRQDDTHVNVHFEIEPGEPVYFGEVQVSGAREDLNRLARKVLGIETGAPYSARDLQDSRDQLRLLGLFRQIRITPRPSAPDTMDLDVEVTERDPRTLESGVGYWTDDGPRVHAGWAHRNLLRRGRGFDVKGAYSQYEYLLQVSTWWPALIGPKTWLTLGGGLERDREDSYDQQVVGGEVSLIYRFSLRNTLRGGVTITKNDVTLKTEDPVFLERPGRMASLLGEWRYDTSDDPLDPSRGWMTHARVEWTPPGDFSDNFFVNTRIGSAVYVGLPKGFVGASRVGVGWARPLASSVDLLPSKRFFSGGASSHRGFQRRRLGPKDSAGNPVGGEALLEASAEIRFPLVGILRGALFADLGQVWSSREDFALRDLALGVGPALMLRTPVGPIRADLGYRVSDVETDEPRLVFHFLIGNPY